MAKWAMPKSSEVMAGMMPWKPPKARPLRAQERPMRRTLVKAFRVQEPTVRADSSTSQKMREVPRCRMALSGMNLRAQHDELAARLEAGVHMQRGAGGSDDGCRLHQPVDSKEWC